MRIPSIISCSRPTRQLRIIARVTEVWLKWRHFIWHSRNNESFDPDSDSERADFGVVRSRPL